MQFKPELLVILDLIHQVEEVGYNIMAAYIWPLEKNEIRF